VGKLLSVIGLLLMALAVVPGCGSGDIESAPYIDIKKAFEVTPVKAPGKNDLNSSHTQDLVISNKVNIAIKKSALGSEFLLTGSIIPQSGAATGHGLQTRIVKFHQS